MRAFILSIFVAVALLPAYANAGEESLTHFGTALRGYDAVAYHTESKAVEGDTNHAVHHGGLTYLFSTKANAKAFKADPAKYEPAYNGYCAFGVTKGKKFSTDPKAFKVVDGKLYMNLNARVQEAWVEDIPGYIAKADARWPEIVDTHPSKL